MKKYFNQAIIGWCFFTIVNASLAIPTNPTERTTFLQQYIDGGRHRLPTKKKDKLLILNAVFEYHYLSAIFPESEKARTKVRNFYRGMSKKIKLRGITGTTSEIRPTPETMRSKWATKSRKSKQWPEGYQAHHIIPLVYCSPQCDYLPTVWWNISALTPKAHRDIERSKAFSLLFPRATGTR